MRWPVLEEGHPSLGRHFALAGGVTGCRGAAERWVVLSSPPHKLLVRISTTEALEIFCCCSLCFLFAAPFQPSCKWSSKLYPSLNPNHNFNPKPSWGWTIDSFPPAVTQTKYFSQPTSLQPPLSFCNPLPASLSRKYWHFFLSTLTLNTGWEVLPDLHYTHKQKINKKKIIFLFLQG